MRVARSVEGICNLALLDAGINEVITDILHDNSANSQACQTQYDEVRRSLLMAHKPSYAIVRAALTPYSGVAYDAAHSYAAGDLAQFGSNVYRSLQNANLNNEPDLRSSAAWWAQVTRDGWGFTCPLPPDCLDPIAAWESPSVSPFSTPQIIDRDPANAFNLRNPPSADRSPYALENSNDGGDNLVLVTDLDAPVLKYLKDLTDPGAMPSTFVITLAWHMAEALALSLKGDEKKALYCQGRARATAATAFIVDMDDQQEDPEPPSEFELARRGLT